MKTAISVPDETFERVEEQAAALGMSRSEFYTRAAQSYLELVRAQDLTERIDDALALTGQDESSRAAVVASRRALARDDEEW